MTIYLKNGDTFRIASEESLDMHKTLPVGVYTFQFNPLSGFYLKSLPPFEFKGKRYGENIPTTNRIVSTFESRSHSTGVILVGEKGSGKTLMSKTVSMKAAERGIPTILVGTDFGDAMQQLNMQIQSIDQPCVIIFDEFEKTFGEAGQEQILSLLDGVYNSKKLFLFTVNERYKVSSYMFNRPGRIFYEINFSSLSDEFIREYCEDNLKNMKRLPEVLTVGKTVWRFNFDMLQALVEEMNRYQESAFDSIKFLNISLESAQIPVQIAEVFSEREKILDFTKSEFTLDISNQKAYFNVQYTIEVPEELKRKSLDTFKANGMSSDEISRMMSTIGQRLHKVTMDDVSVFDPTSDQFVFVSKNGLTVKLARLVRREYNFFDKLA